MQRDFVELRHQQFVAEPEIDAGRLYRQRSNGFTRRRAERDDLVIR